MGDRGNICMEEAEGKKIYFYTHWDGSELFTILKNALIKGKLRWDDEPYLARIIFCELVKKDDGITGYGISTGVCDNEHPIFVVNSDKQVVSIEETNKNWTFEDFIQLEADPR